MSARLRAALLLAFVFVCGAGAGAGTLAALGPKPAAGDLPPPLSQLGLDAGQRERARRILDQHRPELEAALADVMPRVRAIQEQVETELRRDVLDEAQRAKLDVLKRTAPPPPLLRPPP